MQVLQDVKDHKAPYWLQDELSEEVRAELEGDCNDFVCNWSEKYNAERSEEECGGPSPLLNAAEKCKGKDDSECKTPTFIVTVRQASA